MSSSKQSNQRRGVTILAAALLSGVFLVAIGCTAPTHTTGRLNLLPQGQADADLARTVRSDPFPSAAESGLAARPSLPVK